MLEHVITAIEGRPMDDEEDKVDDGENDHTPGDGKIATTSRQSTSRARSRSAKL